LRYCAAGSDSNYMRANKIEREPILGDMPGPWGKALERLRLSQPLPLSKKALAKRAKMTPTTYGKIEKGGHTTTNKLQDIADALHVPIEAVLMPNPGTIPDMTVQELLRRLVRESGAIEQQQPLPTVQQKVKELGKFTEETERAEREAKARDVPKKKQRRKKQ
jgi:transcriptional regulator with XRE-family HTH domain